MSEEFPTDVQRFIEQNIESLAQLEALLLLRKEPERQWAAADIGKALYIPPEMADSLLADFGKRGFASVTPPEEVRYVAAVYANMLLLCDAAVSELLMIIRSDEVESGGYQMSDDGRLKRIDKIYGDMLDEYAFIQSFGDDVRLLAKEREREQHEIERLRKQHDII